MKRLMIALVATGCMLVQADVWKDCDGWFNNPVDKNSNSTFDKGELIDSRFGGNSSSTQHQSSPTIYTGGAATITSEDVVSACGRKTLSNQKCIHLNVADVSGTQGASFNFPRNRFDTSKKIITNDAYTILFRYRQDNDYPTTYKDYKAILFNCACERSGSNKSGFCLALQNSASDNQLYLYATSYNGTGLYLTNSVVSAKENVWTELAVIVRASEHKITFGLFQPGCSAVWRDYSPSTSSYADLIPYQGVSSELRFGAYYGWSGHGFKGSLNMAAFWNRALTTNEVFEAFSGGIPSIAKVGFDKSGHDMFAGSSTSVSVKTTDQDLRSIPSSFGVGTELSVAYELDGYQTNLTQVLRLAASSGTGTFSAAIDGVSIGELSVSSQKNGFLFVPASHFATTGSHTLKLTCTGTEGGSVVVDAIDLGGSWRLGLEDDKYSDFNWNKTQYLGTGEDATAGKTDFYLTDGNMHNVKRYITNPGANPTACWYLESKYQKLHFWVPDEVVDSENYSAKYALTVALQSKSGTAWALHDKLRILVTLNGSDTFTYESRYDTPSLKHTIAIDPSYLIAGENVIECRLAGNVDDDGKEGAWFYFDYYKLEIAKFREKHGFAFTIR